MGPENTPLATVAAVQHVRCLPGTTRSHLLRCSDGRFLVVKFRSDAGGPRLLINELLGTLLARKIGLPVPQAFLVSVSPELIAATLELRAQNCRPGLHFGSVHVAPPDSGYRCLVWPESFSISMLANPLVFCGMLAFDQWTCNTDRRQAVFQGAPELEALRPFFIDYGGCFGGAEWRFADSPVRGVYGCPDVYALARNWCSFDPWLSRITNFGLSDLMIAAAQVPEEWLGSDEPLFWRMVETVWERRTRVPELLAACVQLQNLFPKWSVPVRSAASRKSDTGNIPNARASTV
jgi:hypothetical protein